MGTTYKDYMELGGPGAINGSAPMGRLYNFETGKAALNENHRRWIRENLVPLFRMGSGTLFVQLWGYASRVGNAAFNQALSVHRATETKNYLATQINSADLLSRVTVGGYGTSHSGGGPSDNSPVYRAVDVWVTRKSEPRPTPPPPPVRPPEIKPLLKMYIGPGVKGGGFLGIGGAQALEAHLYSVDDYHDTFNLDGEIWTAGLGLGGGVNVELVIAFGGARPTDFIGTKFQGWDFNLSLGGRWGDLLKGAKGLSWLARIGKAAQEAKFGKAALRQILKLSPSEWEQLGNLAKVIRDARSADSNATKPEVNSFDIPLAGAALEVDVFYFWGSVKMIY
jgi:hypothetical protein